MLLKLPPHVDRNLVDIGAQVDVAARGEPPRDGLHQIRLHDASLVVPARVMHLSMFNYECQQTRSLVPVSLIIAGQHVFEHNGDGEGRCCTPGLELRVGAVAQHTRGIRSRRSVSVCANVCVQYLHAKPH